MKKILFPTDFSEVADNAFTYALHVAERLEAEIFFLHVYNLAATEDLMAPTEFFEALMKEEHEQAQQALQRYEQRIQQEADKALAIHPVIRPGYAAEVIAEYCRQEAPDLVIMGTKGAHNRVDAFLGSVTTAVLDQVEVPVLAVPEGATYQQLDRIAYATSFEERDEPASRHLGEISRALQAEVVCVHVRVEQDKVRQGQDLQGLAEMYRQDMGLPGMKLYLLKDAPVADGLAHFIRDKEIDLLAVATHHRGFFERMVHRSLTRELALHQQTPLLVFHV
jgi:nucleotide-binding universal stress UspA family protein